MRLKRTKILDKAEKILMRTVIFMAVTLVVVQAVLVDDPFRTVMGRLGADTAITTTVNTVHQSESHVTLYLKNYSLLPHLQVLVNGNKAGVFDNRYVTVSVQDGDVIEIDGTFYNHSIIAEVLNTTDDITTPVIEQQLSIENNVILVGVVKIKDNFSEY